MGYALPVAEPTPTVDASAYAGTKDMRGNPAFPGLLSRWLWQFYTHRMRPAGRWFLWPTIVFGLYGSISLDLQAYVPFLYCGAVWIVAGLGLLWARPRVTVTLHSPARATAGDTVTLDVTVTQTGTQTGRDLSVLPWRLPPSMDAANRDGTPLPPLAAGQTAHARVGIICRQRGVFTLRGVRVQSDFPFGMLNAYRFYPAERRLLVWPAFHALRQLIIPASGRSPSGEETLALTRGDSFEPLGSRDYRPGDPVRWMDWRATARVGRPIVREWQQEETRRAALVLDNRVPRVGWADDERRAADWERGRLGWGGGGGFSPPHRVDGGGRGGRDSVARGVARVRGIRTGQRSGHARGVGQHGRGPVCFSGDGTSAHAA